MSEYLEGVEMHDTPGEGWTLLWNYNDEQYGLVIPEGFIDSLGLTGGLEPPVLAKVMRFMRLRDGDSFGVEVN